MAFIPRDKNDNAVAPRGIALPFVVTRKVVTDPGIIYTGSDALLFASTNKIGFIACLGAVLVAATLRAVDVIKPNFLEKHPRIAAVAYDDRTPLRSGAMALLVVGGAAVTTGMWVPALASFLLGAANIAMAESISKQDHGNPVDLAPAASKRPSVAALLFKRPDLYLNLGFACAGLMAGGASLLVLPLVGVAFGVGMNNILRGRPEHAGHPKMITAMAALAFAGVGFMTGHGLIAVAHMINAGVIAEFERRVTPGGNIFKVFAESLRTLGRIVHLDKIGLIDELDREARPELSKPLPHSLPVPQIEEPASRLSGLSFRRFFSQSAARRAAPEQDIAPVAMPKPEPERQVGNGM